MKYSFNVLSHDRPKLLGQALDSLMMQTFKDFEIVICDDSDERKDEVNQVLKYYSQFKELRIIRVEPDKRMTVLRNMMMQYSQGDYIVPADDDDLSDPRRLETIDAYIKPDLLFSADADVINEGGGIIGGRERYPLGVQDILIHSATVAFPRLKALEIGGYLWNWRDVGDEFTKPNKDGFYVVGDDFNFYRRLLASGCKFGYVPELVAHYRRHENNVTSHWS